MDVQLAQPAALIWLNAVDIAIRNASFRRAGQTWMEMKILAE